MDTETILNSVNEQVENSPTAEVKETATASEPVAESKTEAPASTTPVEAAEPKNDVKDTSGAPEASAEVKASEPTQQRERKVFHRSTSPLRPVSYTHLTLPTITAV